jgi:hypothetical protein
VRERQHADLEAARAAYAAGRAADVNAHLERARSAPLDAITAIQLDTVEAETLLWVERRARTAAAMWRAGTGIRGNSGFLRLAQLWRLGAANDAALQEGVYVESWPRA